MPLVVCAPNAFKGTLSAAEAAAAMARGVRSALPEATVVERPVADGGDGTLDVLLAAAVGAARVQPVEVGGPLGDPVEARLGWLDGTTAVVELAGASGLALLPGAPGPAVATAATSRGTGELLRAALDGGARRVVVCLGGSASTDGGAGILAALGARLVDAAGRDLPDGGGALAALAVLDTGGLDPRLAAVRLEVAVDTRVAMLGPGGAAAVFAPQKGAGPSDVARLEAGLARLAAAAGPEAHALATAGGTGAAGGCAWALAALLGATLVPGATLVCDAVALDAALAGASLCITGEGRLDAQTATGKAPAEVLRRARAAGVPCVAIAGVVDDAGGFDAAVSLVDLAGGDVARSRGDAGTMVERAAAQVARALRGSPWERGDRPGPGA